MLEYLEQRVFESLPSSLQDFALKASLLDRLEPSVCDEAFGRTDAESHLRELCRRHLFVSTDGTGYRLHRIFRAFLRDRLVQRHGTAVVGEWHHRIADALLAKGRVTEALLHYVEGGRYDRAATLLRAMTMSELIGSRAAHVIRAFEALPKVLVDPDPRLIRLGAWIASFRGDLPTAIDAFLRARREFEAAGEDADALLCRKDLALHRYLAGDVEGARASMSRLWGKMVPDPFFQVEVAGHLILFHAILGEFEAADKVLDTMLSVVGKDREAGFARSWLRLCHAMRLLLSGQFEDAFAQRSSSDGTTRTDSISVPAGRWTTCASRKR